MAKRRGGDLVGRFPTVKTEESAAKLSKLAVEVFNLSAVMRGNGGMVVEVRELQPVRIGGHHVLALVEMIDAVPELRTRPGLMVGVIHRTDDDRPSQLEFVRARNLDPFELDPEAGGFTVRLDGSLVLPTDDQPALEL